MESEAYLADLLAMRLNLRRRARKRLVRPPQPLDAPVRSDEVWALDFMSDSLYQGRRFRTLDILDEGVREGLAIEIDISLPAERVVRTLQQLITWRGRPKAIRLDNGPRVDRAAIYHLVRGDGQ
jgi:putative transposase